MDRNNISMSVCAAPVTQSAAVQTANAATLLAIAPTLTSIALTPSQTLPVSLQTANAATQTSIAATQFIIAPTLTEFAALLAPSQTAQAATQTAQAATASPTPTVSAIFPETGFSPRHATSLLMQPTEKAYIDLDELWLEVPRLHEQLPIVGVRQVDGEWDVTWLGDQAGWLDGSTFPTWTGNSVLTGHVWNASNLPGPFNGLDTLQYGDQVIVHGWGSEYIYEVRSINRVLPGNIAAMMKHEESSWVTLVTCRGYDEASDTYKYRVLVRAVLVEVK
jgi:LPXTG-site transpeptidase (sortase) family protein